jgi:hypothetical protein
VQVGVQFVSLRRHVLDVLGANTLEDEALLLAHETVVHVDGHGRATALAFPPHQTEMARRLMQLVWSEIQLTTAENSPWEVMETTQHGDVMSRYQHAAAANGTAVLERVRNRYARLNVVANAALVEQDTRGTAHAVLAGAGHPVSLDAQEHLTVRRNDGVVVLTSQAATSLRLLRVEPFAVDQALAAAAAVVPSTGPMDVVESGAGRRNALLLRAAGLTGAQLVLDIRAHATMERLPDHNRWLWRATGLLKLEPALCSQLVTLFQDKTLGQETRALILDLLVGAGHATAQEAMRDILRTRVAGEGRNASLMYQRLSLVKDPTPQTMQFLLDNFQATRGTPRNPRQYALGSGAGHRYRAGDRAGGLAAAAPLVEDLATARDPQRQVWLLEALGNAGLPEHASLVAGYASSPDPDVRRAAATALRKMPDAPNRGVLLGLLDDASVDVQLRALLSLDVRTLTEAELQRVLDLVRQGAVDQQNYQSLVTMLQPALGTQDVVVAIYRAILEQTLQDPTVKSRIRNLLGV